MEDKSNDKTCDIFRARMRELRVRKKLSQSELARMMCVKPSYICDIEKGRRKGVTLATVVAVADALDVSVIKLLR